VLARLHRYRAPAIIDELTRRAKDLSADLPVSTAADSDKTPDNRGLTLVETTFSGAEARLPRRKQQIRNAKLLP
jgi:hypothetical protein